MWPPYPVGHSVFVFVSVDDFIEHLAAKGLWNHSKLLTITPMSTQ